MSDSPTPVTPDEDRLSVVWLDQIKRCCIGEVVEETDEIYRIKAPAWLNHQLVPQTDPNTGQPIADPKSDPKNPKPLLGLHTMWVPFMYVESLEDRDTGFVIDLKKADVEFYEGLRPAIIETYRLKTMGIGQAEEAPQPASPGGDEEKPLDLFAGE